MSTEITHLERDLLKLEKYKFCDRINPALLRDYETIMERSAVGRLYP
ncbi:MAG: hypothetical protein ISS36_02845 [Candidatus Aenigmarchaeota archaeon]|nr:hypothetical protein [Candidatus Aenigmarchaeota archaeon]